MSQIEGIQRTQCSWYSKIVSAINSKWFLFPWQRSIFGQTRIEWRVKIKPDVGNKNFSGGVATQSSPIRKLFVSELESESHLSHDERHKTFVCCVGELEIGFKEIFTPYWFTTICGYLQFSAPTISTTFFKNRGRTIFNILKGEEQYWLLYNCT